MIENLHTTKHIPLLWFAVIAIILAALCVYFLFKTFKNLKLSRIISNTPLSKLRSAAQGFVKVSGTVSSLPNMALLSSPLKQRPCCWYRYTIEREERDDNNNTEWVTVAHGESHHLFQLTDSTGQCIIFPSNSDITGAQHDTWYQYGNIQDNDIASNFLGKLGHVIDQATRYRYQEFRITPDQNALALGFFQTLHTKNTPNPIIDHPAAEKMKVQLLKIKQSTSKHPFLNKIYDSLMSKQLEEFQNAATQWDNYAKTTESANLLSHHQMIDRPFIISNFDEKTLVKHYRRSVFLDMIAFIGFGIATIVFIALKLKGAI